MFGLVDGETVVAAVKAVSTEESDRVVDTDVVEVLDAVVWADVVEETDVFFLALSDCIKQRESAPVLGLTEAILISTTHVKVPIRFYFRIRKRINSLVEGRIFARMSETCYRIRCFQSSCRILSHASNREKWKWSHRTISSPSRLRFSRLYII
jgi:hypothetical protein